MPARVPEKIAFLDGELSGLKSRIGGQGNSVQWEKLRNLQEIRDDYQQSLERAKQRAAEENNG